MTEQGELITQSEAAERRLAEHAPPATGGDITPARMLQIAVQQGADLDKLEKLMDLQDRWERKQNERAFFEALARAQAVMPVVKKNKEGHHNATYADYGELVRTVAPVLAAEGLSFHHDIEQADGLITVHCALSGHGHSERVTLSGAPDDSGAKNSIQQVKSTVTYLRRATLEAVAGAATSDDDDDGRGASAPPALISASNLATLNAAIEEVGADRPAFLKYLGVAALEELTVDNYGKAINALDTKRRKAAEAREAAPEDAAPEPHEIMGAG